MSNPPVIDKNALPSTSVHEWATQTSSSLGQRSEEEHDTPIVSSGTSTPGQEFPGAFPSDGSSSEEPGESRGVLETCKSYIPGQKDVENVVLSASETARQYLPDAMTSYLPSSKVSPADDKPAPDLGGKAKEKVHDETSSPLVKDYGAIQPNGGRPQGNTSSESQNSQQSDTSFLTPHTNASSDDFNSISNISTYAQDGSETSMKSVPATPTGSSYPAFLGPPVGGTTENGSNSKDFSTSGDTLHTNPREASINDYVEKPTKQEKAVPEVENQVDHEPVINTSARTHPLAAEGAKWKGVPLSESYQRALDNNEERQLNLCTGKDNTPALQPAAQKQTTGDQIRGALGVTTDASSNAPRPTAGANYDSTRADVGHSPAAHKPNASAASPSTEDQSLSSSQDQHSVRGSSKSSEGSPHKSTFMEKIKGEVKVISGKLAHNEEKVEEGKRMMGKSV